ncbi:hypothetical protein, partial [Nostoc commune]|uniref:hypothetical protein n=1 Tax=Nostoc commune TaxID=1178 RepID=UPI001E5F05D9
IVFALTLNPSPKKGEGQLSGSPSPKFGRRGWGMRGFSFDMEYLQFSRWTRFTSMTKFWIAKIRKIVFVIKH